MDPSGTQHAIRTVQTSFFAVKLVVVESAVGTCGMMIPMPPMSSSPSILEFHTVRHVIFCQYHDRQCRHL